MTKQHDWTAMSLVSYGRMTHAERDAKYVYTRVCMCTCTHALHTQCVIDTHRAERAGRAIDRVETTDRMRAKSSDAYGHRATDRTGHMALQGVLPGR